MSSRMFTPLTRIRWAIAAVERARTALKNVNEHISWSDHSNSVSTAYKTADNALDCLLVCLIEERNRINARTQ